MSTENSVTPPAPETPTAAGSRERRERFVRIAERRVNKILDDLDSLSKCANRKNYDYSEKDIKSMFGEIEKRTREARGLFQEGDIKKEFRLSA